MKSHYNGLSLSLEITNNSHTEEALYKYITILTLPYRSMLIHFVHLQKYFS